MKTDKVVKKSGQAVKVRGLSKIGGRYYYRLPQMDGVRPPRRALETSSFEEAVDLALQIRNQRAPQYTPGTLIFETDRYMRERKAKKLSRWTLDADQSVLKLFGVEVGITTMVAAVTPRLIEAWREKMRRSGHSEPTVKTYLLRVHGFFAWLVKEGGLPRNPMLNVELPLVRKTRAERFLTKEQRDKLISACDQDDLKTMLMLGFHAGLRLNEMLEARVEWLRLWEGGGEIVVCATDTFVPKDREARRVPLNDVLWRYLSAIKFSGTYLVRDDVRRKKQKYRWIPRHTFERLVSGAELGWVGWHTLRHTYATLLVMGGCPVATVARWLGDGIEVTYKNYVGCIPLREHVNAGL
jgi:integrase